MFQRDFPSVIRSSKLHMTAQVFVRPVLLPAASLFRTAAGLEMFRNAYVMYWAITAIGVATLVYAVGTKR